MKPVKPRLPLNSLSDTQPQSNVPGIAACELFHKACSAIWINVSFITNLISFSLIFLFKNVDLG
ncbi:hypothetical protein [Glaesserella parasuis]|uniref:hypothetical protein n=1 Tax=Glaesserella parasuis TaxID=738 RepID=UPI0004A190A7|nr:hypothetical protein [Glaesserella parasuis]KDD79537.1 hypothetical protein HPS42_09815 [Glaesserella parasuis ST4-2]